LYRQKTSFLSLPKTGVKITKASEGKKKTDPPYCNLSFGEKKKGKEGKENTSKVNL